MRFPLLCLLVVFLLGSARAAEPFFKKGDVIALVGGEDMVVASEYGYLELLLTRALPDYHLKFRNLAWEGDTVFEQRRDLNFPTWEEQLDKIGATVVICQFGKMESLAGKAKLPEFIAAYEKLLKRFSGDGKAAHCRGHSPFCAGLSTISDAPNTGQVKSMPMAHAPRRNRAISKYGIRRRSPRQCRRLMETNSLRPDVHLQRD